MQNLINEIKTLYKYFNGENYVFFAVFLISIVIIFTREKNKRIKDFFVGYTLVIFLVIWNPICIYLLNKFINIGSMYRIYYMLPNILTIAYAMTKVVEIESKVRKAIAVLAMCFVIINCGRLFYNELTMIKVNNNFKLPDEDVEIARIIADDEQTDYKKALVPYGMSSHIRQIEPQIKMLYTRVVTNIKDANGNSMPQDSDDPANYRPVQILNSGNARDIAEMCRKNKVNYVVMNKSTQLIESMENYGFELYKSTDNYNVYKLTKSVKKK